MPSVLDSPKSDATAPVAKRVKRPLPSITSAGPWRQGMGPPKDSLPVVSPVDGETIATVEQGGSAEVDAAVSAAQTAFPEWSSYTMKRRAALMMKFQSLVEEHKEEFIELIMRENGKNRVEAMGDLAKGMETVQRRLPV